MDIFDKATKAVKEVGSSVVNTAASVGSSIGNATREQTELANLRIQKTAIEKKLESRYAEIGKRYIAYISDSFQMEAFDVTDVLDEMQPDLDKVREIVEQIDLKEQQIRQNNREKDRKRAQDQFESEKKKLDKARDLDVISEDEYDDKLAQARKKLENFETLKKIQMQYEMDIITKEEYEEKVKNILQ